MHKNIVYSHILYFMHGCAIGTAFITTYVISVSGHFHTGLEPNLIAIMGYMCSFFISYFLEVSNGFRSDNFGERLTFILAYSFRAFYLAFILIPLFILSSSPLLFAVCTIIAYYLYSQHFTLLSGNLEEWVRRNCSEHNCLEIFSRNEMLFLIGQAIGIIIISIFPVSQNYNELLLTASPLFLLSALCCLASIFICSKIDVRGHFSFQAMKSFLQSLSLINFSQRQKNNLSIQNTKQDLKKSKALSYLFWVHSFIFSLDLLLHLLIPIYIFASKVLHAEQKFALLLGCFILPELIGSLSKSKKQKNKAAHQPIFADCFIYFAAICLLPIISIFPIAQSEYWYTDVPFLAFSLLILSYKVCAGRLHPHINSITTKWSNEASSFPKTLLSLGERRKKLAAVLCFLLASLASLIEHSDAYFWITSIISFAFLIYTMVILKFIFPNATKSKYSLKR